MKKKTNGIDDLVATLIKQHGVHESICRAHAQLGHGLGGSKLNEARELIWTCALSKLRTIRDSRY